MISQLTIDQAKKITFKILKERQMTLGYSNYKLSQLSGVPESTLSRIDNGEIKQITIDTYFRICGALGVRPHLEFEEDDKKPYNYEHFN